MRIVAAAAPAWRRILSEALPSRAASGGIDVRRHAFTLVLLPISLRRERLQVESSGPEAENRKVLISSGCYLAARFLQRPRRLRQVPAIGARASVAALNKSNNAEACHETFIVCLPSTRRDDAFRGPGESRGIAPFLGAAQWAERESPERVAGDRVRYGRYRYACSTQCMCMPSSPAWSRATTASHIHCCTSRCLEPEPLAWPRKHQASIGFPLGVTSGSL